MSGYVLSTPMTEDCIASAENSTFGTNFNLDKATIVSFNLHGLNQGKSAICDIIASHTPDIILIQERRLIPANLYKLDDFDGYYAFGSSAMNNAIAQCPLYRRPYGGALIKNFMRCHCETSYAGERFLVLKIYDFVIINVYMPCDGNTGRLNLCEFVLNEMLVWREQFNHCSYILAGDLNVELGSLDAVDKCLSDHRSHCNLFNCFDVYPNCKFISFINDVHGHSSLLDYFLYVIMLRRS
jgi:exonuclease III